MIKSYAKRFPRLFVLTMYPILLGLMVGLYLLSLIVNPLISAFKSYFYELKTFFVGSNAEVMKNGFMKLYINAKVAFGVNIVETPKPSVFRRRTNATTETN